MSSTFPLISIALCTYNGEPYLRKQLDSLVNQSYPNLEIIAIDDQSNDHTFIILQEYERKFPIFKAIRNESNLGFIKNFEKAIKACNGEFISVSDQDDIWELDKISILYQEIGENMLIYHDSQMIDQFDNKISDHKISNHTLIHHGSCNLYFINKNSVSGHASMFKKELKKYIFPFDERFYYDWWIAFVAASVGTIKYIPNTLVYYRKHETNVTNSISNAKERQKFLPGNKYFKFDLAWIKHLSTFSFAKNASVIQKIYTVLYNYSHGKKGLSFFLFLLKYNSIIFYIDKKGAFSRLNHIRKIYSADINKHQ